MVAVMYVLLLSIGSCFQKSDRENLNMKEQPLRYLLITYSELQSFPMGVRNAK